MSTGKAIRLERIFNRHTKKSIIVPMDHGVSVGPIKGLENMTHAVDQVARGGANAVLGHKGLVQCGHRRSGPDMGLILHLSSSTDLSPHPHRKTLTASVEDALRLGADAVSIHINLGDPHEAEMLRDFGKVASSCDRWGMPLMAMLYARGPEIKNSLDPELIAHCARVGVELGADIIKVPYTGDIESFNFVTESCCVPVLIAGGPKTNSTREFIQMVEDSLKAGGSGLSVGRNIFQHNNPALLSSALSALVHQEKSLDEVMDMLGEA